MLPTVRPTRDDDIADPGSAATVADRRSRPSACIGHDAVVCPVVTEDRCLVEARIGGVLAVACQRGSDAHDRAASREHVLMRVRAAIVQLLAPPLRMFAASRARGRILNPLRVPDKPQSRR